MNYETLKAFQADLHMRIRETAAKKIVSGKSSNLIFDGVPKIDAYLSSSPKIMWILKEAYGEEGTDNNWDIWDGFDSLEAAVKSPTWRIMMYVIYGVRTGLHLRDMPENPNIEMLNTLNGVAYINVNKFAATTHSGNMQKQFGLWHGILLRQIKGYAPDIIIFGNTFSLFEKNKDDFATDSIFVGGESGKAPVYKSPDGVLLIDTWHPNNRKMKRSEYVDSIIDGVLNNFH